MQDLEDDDDDDDEDASGQFFNELFSLQVDNDKASWQKSKSLFDNEKIEIVDDMDSLSYNSNFKLRFDSFSKRPYLVIESYATNSYDSNLI